MPGTERQFAIRKVELAGQLNSVEVWISYCDLGLLCPEHPMMQCPKPSNSIVTPLRGGYTDVAVSAWANRAVLVLGSSVPPEVATSLA